MKHPWPEPVGPRVQGLRAAALEVEAEVPVGVDAHHPLSLPQANWHFPFLTQSLAHGASEHYHWLQSY